MPACFPADRLFLIAGPCQVEGDDLMFRVANHLARLAERVPGGIIFKASFDKANRSNAGAARGPGIEAGLASLVRVRERSGLPVLTDVHLPEQCAPAAHGRVSTSRRSWERAARWPKTSCDAVSCRRTHTATHCDCPHRLPSVMMTCSGAWNV